MTTALREERCVILGEGINDAEDLAAVRALCSLLSLKEIDSLISQLLVSIADMQGRCEESQVKGVIGEDEGEELLRLLSVCSLLLETCQYTVALLVKLRAQYASYSACED